MASASVLPLIVQRLESAALGVGRALAAHMRDPVARERSLAAGVFALIFAGLVGGVDYVITGGPAWNPNREVQITFAPPQAYVRAPAPTFTNYTPPPSLPVAEAYDVRDYGTPMEDLLGGPSADFRQASFEAYERVSMPNLDKILEVNAF